MLPAQTHNVANSPTNGNRLNIADFPDDFKMHARSILTGLPGLVNTPNCPCGDERVVREFAGRKIKAGQICAFVIPIFNPKRIESSSPGLRACELPWGKRFQKYAATLKAERVAAPGFILPREQRVPGITLSGLRLHTFTPG